MGHSCGPPWFQRL